MNKKKKINKSSADIRKRKRQPSSLRAESALKSTGSANSHSLTGKIGGIWKRNRILLAVSVIVIVILAFCGTIAYQNAIKEKPAFNPVTANSTTANISPTALPPSTDKIEIRDVVVTDIKQRNITVMWKTNIPSSSQVVAMSDDSIAGWPDNNLVLEHKVVLEGLKPATTYFLLIKSKDASGNEAKFEIKSPYQTRSPRFSTEMAIGETSPDFLLPAVTGDSVRLSAFRGKWVMIVFWMTSCSGCREELPYLDKFWTNSKYNDFILLTINVGGQEVVTKNYVISQKLMFPVLLDKEEEVSEKYTVANFPTIFLIDPGGTVNKIKQDSFKNELEIDEFVRSAIQSE